MPLARTTVQMLGAALSAALACCRTPEPFGSAQRASEARSICAGWTRGSRLAASGLIERYGPPDALAENALAWKEKGPWKRIVVWNAGRESVLAGDLRETAAYRVPESRRADVAAFSSRISVSSDGSEVSALADDESYNFLALNLAVEVARGDLTPEEARRSFALNAELAASGKTADSMRRLLFSPP